MGGGVESRRWYALPIWMQWLSLVGTAGFAAILVILGGSLRWLSIGIFGGASLVHVFSLIGSYVPSTRLFVRRAMVIVGIAFMSLALYGTALFVSLVRTSSR